MFIPSEHGFKFENCWEDYPILWGLGNAGKGLCGGMSTAACDYYYEDQPIPQYYYTKAIPDVDVQPIPDDPLFQYICQRNVDIIDIPWGAAKIYWWSLWQGSLFDSSIEEIKKLKFPSPLMLVWAQSFNPFKTAENHVVVACDMPAMGKIKIYDPNDPGDDEVWIDIDYDNKIISHTYWGEMRGLIALNYAPKSPPHTTKLLKSIPSRSIYICTQCQEKYYDFKDKCDKCGGQVEYAGEEVIKEGK